MQAAREYQDLVELIAWIDQKLHGLELPTEQRYLLAIGCFDVALEHQAAIALLHSSALPGSELALLRVLVESCVRGLWLLHCASESELDAFKRGKLEKSFQTLICEFERRIDEENGVLSAFKANAWTALNGFTHTGFTQVARRHAPGFLQANYPDYELAQALDAAGVFGLLAAAQLAALSHSDTLVQEFKRRMEEYAGKRASA